MDPKIVFPESVVFGGEQRQGWPELERVVLSGQQLAADFEIAQKALTPMLRDDPRLGRISEVLRNEVLELYNKVVADGRYLGELGTHPAEVAGKLNIAISDDAAYIVGTIGQRLIAEFKAGNAGRKIDTYIESATSDEGRKGQPTERKWEPPNVKIIATTVIGAITAGVAAGVAVTVANPGIVIGVLIGAAESSQPGEVVMDKSGFIKIS